MTAYATTGAGNWSNAGGTIWDGDGGPPADGDTASIGHNVAVDQNTTVGAGGATGTVAITLAGGNLTVNDGITFTVKGGILHSSSSTVTVGAGCAVVIVPASGAQYTVDLKNASNVPAKWIINGTSGSRSSLSTDTSGGGSATYFDISTANFRDVGVMIATYVDFSDFGDASHPGVRTQTGESGANTTVTLSNCTFTRCSYHGNMGVGNSWDGNFTFSNNIFSDSVTNTDGYGTWCSEIAFQQNPTSGTRTVSYCSFDKSATFVRHTGMVIDYNYFGITYNNSVSIKTVCSSFTGNFIRFYSTLNDRQALGNATGSFWLFDPSLGGSDSNPHYVAVLGLDNSITVDGCVFESAGSDGNGDCITIGSPSASATATVQNCIFLPNASGENSGRPFSALGNANSTVVCEHNTYFMGTQGAAFGETYTGHAGLLASFRSNLAWDTSARGRKLYDDGTLDAVDDYITVADYNGGYNFLTSVPAGADATNAANGYVGSSTTDPFAATPGTNDVNEDPSFVDSSRDLGSWGSTVHSTDGSVSAALAVLAANPSLIYDTGNANALVQWIRAGFAPQNANYNGTAHDAGDIGAVAYQSAVSSYTTVREETFYNETPFDQDEVVGTARAYNGSPPYTWEIIRQTLLP